MFHLNFSAKYFLFFIFFCLVCRWWRLIAKAQSAIFYLQRSDSIKKKINSDNILNEIFQSNGLLMHSVWQKSSVAIDILQKWVQAIMKIFTFLYLSLYVRALICLTPWASWCRGDHRRFWFEISADPGSNPGEALIFVNFFNCLFGSLVSYTVVFK